MNNTILENLREYVHDEDDLYILGDLTLGPREVGIEMIKQIPGHIHIILGNHDTDARIELYKQLPNVVEIVHATRFNYKKYHFYLSHYPTMTYNLDGADNLKTVLINLHGHTHATSPFYMDIPYIYNVGMDAHNCMPLSIDEVLLDIKDEWLLCKTMADGDEPVKTFAPTPNPEPEPKKEEPPQLCKYWDEGFCMRQKGMPEVWCDNHEEKCECKTQEEEAKEPSNEKDSGLTKFIKEQENIGLDLLWKYERENCDKCVYFCKPFIYYEDGCLKVNCPNGCKFKRDPPDGGYYG